MGSQLSNGRKAHLMGLIRQGLFLDQVITHHKAYVKEKALNNEPMTYDIFVLPSNVINLAKIIVDELWQKHRKDLIDVKLWVLKIPNSIFIMSSMPFWT
jgi:hypothetical protein